MICWPVDGQGKIITQSQLTILKAVQCEPQTPALPKIPAHHDLVKKAVDFIRDDEKSAGGALGKKSGVKYRVYMRLDRFIKENEGSLFVTDALKKAIDDIYKFPMKEYPRDVFNRHLKAGISDEDLAGLVVSLREDDRLCIVDQEPENQAAMQIICSMGLANG